jgi:hypothetical protein
VNSETEKESPLPIQPALTIIHDLNFQCQDCFGALQKNKQGNTTVLESATRTSPGIYLIALQRRTKSKNFKQIRVGKCYFIFKYRQRNECIKNW